MPVRSTGGERAVVYISLLINIHHRQCSGIRCGCRWCALISWSSGPFRLHDSFPYSPNHANIYSIYLSPLPVQRVFGERVAVVYLSAYVLKYTTRAVFNWQHYRK